MQDVILSVQDLEVEFTLRGKTLHAIRGISLDICEGESLAIVGESGSGKSAVSYTHLDVYKRQGGANKAAKPKAPETLYGIPSACFQHFAE